jgi:hypothetical protein
MSFVWYLPIGCLMTILVGRITSEVFKRVGIRPSFDVDDKNIVHLSNVGDEAENADTANVEIGEAQETMLNDTA